MIVPCDGRVSDACCCPSIRAGIVSPASVHAVRAVKSTPHDHFAAAPYGCVIISWGRCVGVACKGPTIRLRIVSSAEDRKLGTIIIGAPTPNDHFDAGPHRCVKDSGRWGGGGACRCPTVCAAIISPAGQRRTGSSSAPDDHFTASPYRGSQEKVETFGVAARAGQINLLQVSFVG